MPTLTSLSEKLATLKAEKDAINAALKDRVHLHYTQRRVYIYRRRHLKYEIRQLQIQIENHKDYQP